MKVELSETIARPVSEVFSFYADDHLKNQPRWDEAMELTQVSAGQSLHNSKHLLEATG